MTTFDSHEESVLREFFLGPNGAQPKFHDDLCQRIIDAYGRGSPKDLAVLIRQSIRRVSERDEGDDRVQLAPTIESLIRPVAVSVGLRKSGQFWYATPYKPDWLDATVPVDFAAIAGTYRGPAQSDPSVPADPVFTRLTKWPTYRTPGQRVAARAALTVEDGATLITLLPTGSGKTEVALCLADRHPGAVSLIVVPTVSLALDFERRFQEHYARRNALVDKAALRFTWTADTSMAERDAFRGRLAQGRQPLLVTSPESITGALRDQMLELAGIGRLAAIIVDEAHLVTQWGRTFRPEFRTLARMRRDLVERARQNERTPPVTMLMSATLNSRTLEDLHALFSAPGPCTLIAGNALRAEPQFWVASESDVVTRRAHTLEALDQLPRPAVLYVTMPDDAHEWINLLRDRGYSRIASVTGLSSDDERRDALTGIRTGPEGSSRYDLVVATSAFGLGIDYGHVRSVIHACIPETTDRWYQEVGRGGRDGDPSVALLCPSTDDWKIAKSLAAPTILLEDTAMKRWRDLWKGRRQLQNYFILDLQQARGGIQEGDYNLRWNNQLVQAMVELGAIEPIALLADDVRALNDELGGSAHTHTWFAGDLQRMDLDDPAWWEKYWKPWRSEEMSRSNASLDNLRAVISGDVRVCSAITEEYRPSNNVIRLFGEAAQWVAPETICGRCPRCRSENEEARPEGLPSPNQYWIPEPIDVEQLQRFIRTVGTDDGLAVITSADVQTSANELASRLLKVGVRHFSGCDQPQTAQTIFWDPETISPDGLSPLPSLVVIECGDLRYSRWLSRLEREANRPISEYALDVLLISDDVEIPKGMKTKTIHAALAELSNG